MDSEGVNFALSAMSSQAVIYSQNSKFMLAVGLELIDSLAPKKNDKVLDIGCGAGYHASVFAERVGAGGKVVGVDPDKDRVKIASEQYGKSNVVIQVGDSGDFPEDHYAIVFSNYVIHWIKDKGAVFKKVSQNMRPGGKFGFTIAARVPQLLVDVSYLMGPEKGKTILEKFHFNTPEEFETLAHLHGFVVIKKEIGVQYRQLPDLDSVLKFWCGVTHGEFDPLAVDETAVEGFKKQYPMIEWSIELYTFILTKP